MYSAHFMEALNPSADVQEGASDSLLLQAFFSKANFDSGAHVQVALVIARSVVEGRRHKAAVVLPFMFERKNGPRSSSKADKRGPFKFADPLLDRELRGRSVGQ